MDQKSTTTIWASFEEVAPNLCYIQKTRELLGNLVAGTDDVERLLERLGSELAASENPSFRTDIRILRDRLHKRIKQIPLE